MLFGTGFIIGTTFLSFETANGEVYAVIDWNKEDWDYEGVPPPKPQFYFSDSDLCRSRINDRYTVALDRYEEERRNDADLLEYYNSILDKQAQYGVELVDNSDFQALTVSDWADSNEYTDGAAAPSWSTELTEVLGASAEPLSDVEAMAEAFETLFLWREELEWKYNCFIKPIGLFSGRNMNLNHIAKKPFFDLFYRTPCMPAMMRAAMYDATLIGANN